MNLDMDRQIREVAAVCDYVQALRQVEQAALAVVRRVERLVPRPQRRRRSTASAQFAPRLLEEVYNLEDALLVGGFVNTLLRNSDRVRVGCLAQLVNVIAPLVTNETGVLRQSIYYPYAWALRYARGRVLDLRVEAETYPITARRAPGRLRPQRSGAVRRRRRHARRAERSGERADAEPRPGWRARAGRWSGER